MKKNKNFDPKEPWLNSLIVWACELPIGSATVKTKFSFF